jgi:hypothetical protein
MNSMIKLCLSMILLAASSVPAMAAAPVELTSDVFVEKQQKRPDGSFATVLAKPNLILPGDQLVFVVRYRNAEANLQRIFRSPTRSPPQLRSAGLRMAPSLFQLMAEKAGANCRSCASTMQTAPAALR